MLSLSQQQIAELLGVSFQQVQKYENGKNRISTAYSKILKEKLGIDLLHDTAIKISDASAQLNSSEVELIQTFRRIRNPAVKNIMLKLLKEYSQE